MYCEQFVACIGVLACYLMVVIGFMLPDRITNILEKWEGYWFFIGSCLFFTTWIHLCIGLRVIHGDNQIKMVTAFYPLGKTLGDGYKIDTLKHIARCYEQDTKYSVNYDDMFVLKGKLCYSLFSKHALIACGKNFEFREKDFGHGKLYICSYTDTTGVKHEIDMYGNDIQDSHYSPKVIDTSIDYNSTMY